MQFYCFSFKIAALILLATPFASAVCCIQVNSDINCAIYCLNNEHPGGYCDDCKRFSLFPLFVNAILTTAVRSPQLYMLYWKALVRTSPSKMAYVSSKWRHDSDCQWMGTAEAGPTHILMENEQEREGMLSWIWIIALWNYLNFRSLTAACVREWEERKRLLK